VSSILSVHCTTACATLAYCCMFFCCCVLLCCRHTPAGWPKCPAKYSARSVKCSSMIR
jgi:hypothetical protein